MPRWISILVGLVLSPILGLLAYVVSTEIVLDMLETCLQEVDAGDRFIVVILLFPAVLTIAATAITYTVVHVLIERNWSIYVAVAAAVLITPVMVVYAINSQYDPAPTELCPAGTPPWWPWPVSRTS
jgi:Ca2+/H+ antiporter